MYGCISIVLDWVTLNSCTSESVPKVNVNLGPWEGVNRAELFHM